MLLFRPRWGLAFTISPQAELGLSLYWKQTFVHSSLADTYARHQEYMEHGSEKAHCPCQGFLPMPQRVFKDSVASVITFRRLTRLFSVFEWVLNPGLKPLLNIYQGVNYSAQGTQAAGIMWKISSYMFEKCNLYDHVAILPCSFSVG